MHVYQPAVRSLSACAFLYPLIFVRCVKSEVILVALADFSARNVSMVYLLNNSIATFPSVKHAYCVSQLSINHDKMS